MIKFCKLIKTVMQRKKKYRGYTNRHMQVTFFTVIKFQSITGSWYHARMVYMRISTFIWGA